MSDMDAVFANMDKAVGAPAQLTAPDSSAQLTPQQPTSAPKDSFDAIFQNMDRAVSSTATQNVLQAQGSNPDKAAQALQLSKENGVPQPAVESNLQDYQQQAQTQKNIQTIDQNPNLANFVANNPLAARLASDDFDKLGFLEKTWKAITTGTSSALESNQLGRLGMRKQEASALGIQTPQLDQSIQQASDALQRTPSLIGGFGALQSAFQFGVAMIDNAAKGGAQGSLVGASIGAALTPEAAGAGALIGAPLGFSVGFMTDMASVAAGNQYLKLGNMRGTDGQPISEAGKQFSALFTGLTTYALGSVGLGGAGKLAGESVDKLAAQALDQALTRPVFRQALTNFGASSVKGVAGGAALNLGMEASSVIGEELAKAVSPGQFDTNPQEIVDRLEHAAITGALTLGSLHMAMGGIGLYGDFRAAKMADQNAQMFTNLMNGATESKLRDRDQQVFQDLMQYQTEGTPAENIYIPVDKIRELYQSGKIDPNVDRANDPLFGFVQDMPEQIREATATGGDVVIPTADYITHLAGTPVSDKLMPDMRLGANAMSVNDAKTFNEEYQTRLKAASEVAAKQEEAPNPTQDIFNDVQKQAQEGGYTKTEANQYGSIYAQRYTTRAERLGVDPMEAYQKSGVSIVDGESANKESQGNVLNQENRGSIQLGDGKAIISLFKDADRSSLIHETGHLWLDELGKDALIEGAPKQLKDDLDITLKWLGAESTDKITTGQHEQFARAVEAYFMEGKAPSKDLAGVFSRFKTWLTKIYQNISNLNTPINDDIRGVFDRLLATDAQLEQARQNQGLTPAFRSKEEAGMTTAEWKSYTSAIDKANQQAESTMLEKTMAGVRKQRTAEYKEQLRTIKDKVAARVDARQDIKALTLVTKGTLDGEKVEGIPKLNRAEVERQYGKEGVTDLPKNATAKDGTDPEMIAEILGYQSADVMIKDLKALEQQQREARVEDGERRGIRQILIDQQAEQEMQAKHGDIMDEQSMHDEAMAAIHSDGQTELLATELRYLKRMGAQALVERGQGRRAVKEYATKADWDAAQADLMHKMDLAKAEENSDAKIADLKQQIGDLKMADRWNKAEANTTQAALREAVTVTKPMLDAIRAHVDTILQEKTVSDIGNFNKYARDERKAAREVQNAILKKDWNEAAAAKQRQLLANILYVKAKAASKDIDRGVSMMEKLAAKPSFKSLSQEYLNQIHDLIGRFGFDSRRGEELQRTKGATLEEFVQNKYEEGIEIAVDRSLFDASGSRIDDMKLSEFAALHLAVDSMRQVGMSDKIITVNGEKREFNEVRDELASAIRAFGERAKSEYLNPKSAPLSERTKEKIFEGFRSLDASLVKVERLFTQIDNNDPFGIANTAIFRKMKDAEHNSTKWSEEAAKYFKEAADAMPKDWVKNLSDILPVDPTLIDPKTNAPTKLARKDLLGMILNWGNQGNRDRLSKGFNWDQNNIKAFIDRNATKDDLDFAQHVWDIFDRYKEPLDKLQQRVTGIGLDMVHADPFDTPHGKYEGGYYPVIEDKTRSYRAEEHAEKATNAMLNTNYGRATTAHGNTISRIGGDRPISIDLDFAPLKIGQTIHDIAMREAIIDSNRLLSNPKIKSAMDDAFGPEYRKLMLPWLQDLANSRNIDDAATQFWNRMISVAKTNTVIVGIGFRAMTHIKHGTFALYNSVEQIGAKWLLAGTKEFYGPGMAAKWEFIKSKSPDMAYRQRHYDQDVIGQYANIFKDNAFTKFQQQAQYFGHIGISYLDLGSAAPTWLGAYRKGLSENMSDADAVYVADKAVRDAHGGQGMTDRSAMQRVKGAWSLATMFYGFFNNNYNRIRPIAFDAIGGAKNIKSGEYKQASSDFGSVLARSWYLVALPAFIEALIVHGSPNEDKDEGWAGWAAKAITGQVAATIPVVRDIAKVSLHGGSYDVTPVARAVNTMIDAGRDTYKYFAEDEMPKSISRNVVEAAGYAAGLPTAAPFTAGKFLWDYGNGDVDPQNISEWTQGLLKGKITEH